MFENKRIEVVINESYFSNEKIAEMFSTWNGEDYFTFDGSDTYYLNHSRRAERKYLYSAYPQQVTDGMLYVFHVRHYRMGSQRSTIMVFYRDNA